MPELPFSIATDPALRIVLTPDYYWVQWWCAACDEVFASANRGEPELHAAIHEAWDNHA